MTDRTQTRHHPNYVAIWYWLIGLVLFSVLVSRLPLPETLTLGLVFAAAFAKALLVALYYMHLRFERFSIYAFVLIPLLFFIILLGVLFYGATISPPAAIAAQIPYGVAVSAHTCQV